MALLSPAPKITVFKDGVVENGAKIYTYEAGTDVEKTTYTTADGDVAHANPVVCDANGQASIWLGTGLYKFVVKDSDDGALYTIDDIQGGAAGSTAGTIAYVENLNALKALSAGSFSVVNMIGYHTAGDAPVVTYRWNGTSVATPDSGYSVQPAAGGDGRWLANFGETVSVRQYGAKGDNSTDDFAAINSARQYCASSGKTLVFDKGNYIIASNLTLSCNVDFLDDAIIKASTAKTVTVTGDFKGSLDQHFGTNITATLPSNITAYPEWWGITKDNTTDDSSAIQSAVLSGAGRVHITSGTYLLKKSVGITNSIHIFGDGADTVLSNDWASVDAGTFTRYTGNASSYYPVFDFRAQNIILEKLKITSKGRPNSPTAGQITNEQSRAPIGVMIPGNGVTNGGVSSGTDCHYAKVLNCTFDDLTRGILGRESDSSQIGIEVNGNNLTNISPLDGARTTLNYRDIGVAIQFYGTNSLQITNNYVDNTNAREYSTSRVICYGCKKTKITNNVVIQKDASGSYADGTAINLQNIAIAGDCFGSIVDSNSIENGESGVYSFESSELVFSNNNIKNLNSGHGIFIAAYNDVVPSCYNISVVGNAISNDGTGLILNQQYGMNILSGKLLSIVGNTIHGCDAGISVQSGTDVTITGNIIDGRFDPRDSVTTPNMTIGISVNNSSFAISSNHVRYINGNACILGGGSSDAECTFTGNTVRDITGNGLLINNVSTGLSDGRGVTVTGNRIEDCTIWGILCKNQNRYGVYSSNVILDNLVGGICITNDENNDQWSITGNTISENTGPAIYVNRNNGSITGNNGRSNIYAASTGTVTATATNGASPAKLRCTDAGHGLSTGMVVEISGMAVAAHNSFTIVTVIDADTFDCDEIPYDSGTGGGTWTRHSAIVIFGAASTTIMTANNFRGAGSATDPQCAVYLGADSENNIITGNQLGSIPKTIDGPGQYDYTSIIKDNGDIDSASGGKAITMRSLSIGVPSLVTVQANTITPTGTFIKIDAVSPGASTVTQISGGVVGDLLIMTIEDATKPITISNAGNINTAGYTLDSPYDSAMLVKLESNRWLDLGARNNA